LDTVLLTDWQVPNTCAPFKSQTVKNIKNEKNGYDKSKNEILDNQINLHEKNEEKLDWKNEIIRRKMESSTGLSPLILIPLVKYTKPIADLHTSHPIYKQDCQNYCYTPLMNQPLWHEILKMSKS